MRLSRRVFLRSGLGGAGGWLAAAGAPPRATEICLISFREYARIAGRSGNGAVAAGCPPAASGR